MPMQFVSEKIIYLAFYHEIQEFHDDYKEELKFKDHVDNGIVHDYNRTEAVSFNHYILPYFVMSINWSVYRYM